MSKTYTVGLLRLKQIGSMHGHWFVLCASKIMHF